MQFRETYERHYISMILKLSKDDIYRILASREVAKARRIQGGQRKRWLDPVNRNARILSIGAATGEDQHKIVLVGGKN